MLQAARLVRVGGLRACGSGSASLLSQHGFASEAENPRHQGGDPQHQAAQQQQGGDGSSGGGGGGGSEGPRAQMPRRQRNQRKEFVFEEGAVPQSNKNIYPAYICNSLLREDIASFFDGYNLPVEEIRPEYTWDRFQVARFWLAFASAEDRQRALSRSGAYLGTRRVVMRTALPRDFTAAVYNPLAMSSRGRYLLVEGLSTSNTSEDLLRVFAGYDLHAKAVTFLREQEAGELVGKRRQAPEGGSPKEREKVERAVVRFATRQEAHRALRDRQGAFCGGSALRLRVLQ